MIAEVEIPGATTLLSFVMRAAPNGNGRVPDMIFLKDENCAWLKDNYLDGPADIVVEIVGEESFVVDYIAKSSEYARGGVPEYWLIDPLSNRALFLVLGADGIYHQAAINERGFYVSGGLNGRAINPAWLTSYPLPNVIPIYKEMELI